MGGNQLTAGLAACSLIGVSRCCLRTLTVSMRMGTGQGVIWVKHLLREPADCLPVLLVSSFLNLIQEPVYSSLDAFRRH